MTLVNNKIKATLIPINLGSVGYSCLLFYISEQLFF